MLQRHCKTKTDQNVNGVTFTQLNPRSVVTTRNNEVEIIFQV